MLKDEDDYVWCKATIMKKIKIPMDCVKCPDCKGSGEVRRIYGPAWMKNQFDDCLLCGGRGYVEKSYLEFHTRLEEKAKKEVAKK